MSDSPAPASVLYRFWAYAVPPRLEYLSAGADAVMEASAAELAAALASATVPLVGVDPAAFYAAVAGSVHDHAPWQAEFGYVGPRTGRVRWFQAADFPQTAADGTRYFLGTLLDVTARRAAEAAEREAADRLAAHMVNTPLAVIEWDADFRVARWTGAAEVLFGWAAEEVLGKALADFPLVHPDDAGRVDEVSRRLRTGEERRSVVFNRNRHKCGRVLACEWHNSVLFDAAGRVRSVLSLAHDRTPAAEAQAAVAKSEARLRAALTHAHMLGWEHDLVTNQTHYSGDRVAFYGGQDEDDPTVNVVHPADRGRVWQAIRAAAAGGRLLAVEYRGLARSSDGRPRWFLARGQVEADAAGDPVRAVGVTAEITDRVHAAEDRAALDRQLLAAGRRPPPVGGWRGAGRALVADDEPNIRELVATLLEDAGFAVTRAADGPAALAAFRADPAGFRLAVADILMPGLEGDDLVCQLRADCPGLPAVLITGFVTRPVAPAVLAAPATRVLTKPFRVEHLMAAVQAVCGASG